MKISFVEQKIIEFMKNYIILALLEHTYNIYLLKGKNV